MRPNNRPFTKGTVKDWQQAGTAEPLFRAVDLQAYCEGPLLIEQANALSTLLEHLKHDLDTQSAQRWQWQHRSPNRDRSSVTVDDRKLRQSQNVASQHADGEGNDDNQLDKNEDAFGEQEMVATKRHSAQQRQAIAKVSYNAWLLSVAAAQQRAAELSAARDEEAAQAAEERAGRQGIDVRRERAAQRLQRLQMVADTVPAGEDGDSVAAADAFVKIEWGPEMEVEPVAAAATTMVDACVSCHGLVVTAMRAEVKARERWQTLKKRLDNVESAIATELKQRKRRQKQGVPRSKPVLARGGTSSALSDARDAARLAALQAAQCRREREALLKSRGRQKAKLHFMQEDTMRKGEEAYAAIEGRVTRLNYVLEAEAAKQHNTQDATSGRRPSAVSGGNVGSIVRSKPSYERTAAEKAWVGLDHMLHPQLYSHLTEAQEEELEVDEDYRPIVPVSVAERIIRLDPRVNVALPFLRSPAELKAHELFAKYAHGLSDSAAAEADAAGVSGKRLNAAVDADMMIRAARLISLRSENLAELTQDESHPVPAPLEGTSMGLVPLDVPPDPDKEREGDIYESAHAVTDTGVRYLDLRVDVTFWGARRGVQARLGAVLLEVRQRGNAVTKRSIGYAPRALQTVCDADGGSGRALAAAKTAQARLVQLRNDIAHGGDVVRLQERKYTICSTMVKEERKAVREAIDGLLASLRRAREEKAAATALLKAARIELPAVFAALEGANKGTQVRLAHRRNGWNSLTLPEQQWCMLDRSLHPELYEWLQEGDPARGAGARIRDSMDGHHAAYLEQFRYHPKELARIQKLPFADLDRRQLQGATAVIDLDLAAAVRQKDPLMRTQEEREWVALDKVLNPGAWTLFKGEDVTSHGLAGGEKPQARDKYAKTATLKRASLDTVAEVAASFPAATYTRAELLAIWSGEGEGDPDPDSDSPVDLISHEGAQPSSTINNAPTKRFSMAPSPAASTSASQATIEISQQRRRRCQWHRQLLLKYNGSYAEYAAWDRAHGGEGLGATFASALQADATAAATTAAAPAAAAAAAAAAATAAAPAAGVTATPAATRGMRGAEDADDRCLALLQEADRVASLHIDDETDSAILHGGASQRFPVPTLRLELEAELNALLREQYS
ncbi:hypothetical protein JKP88DRAFT_281884 [Tribonema minus]|uniref:Uncharacterized protein n=1 Tax=Tribonema minus TaxID=303371 RepID=A0A836C906_9STRA|nr:hypothetical protein JKP88DRAFT_281884 [Tribonema minus]